MQLILVRNLLPMLPEQQSLFRRLVSRFPYRFPPRSLVLSMILLQEVRCDTRLTCQSSRQLNNKVTVQQHRCWLRSLSWGD